MLGAGLFALLLALPAFAGTLEELNESLGVLNRFHEDRAAGRIDLASDGDPDRLLGQVAILDAGLARLDLAPADVALVRAVRAETLATIAFMQQRRGQAVELANVRRALADIDDLFATGFHAIYPDAGFRAGELAFSLLHDDRRARRYFRDCAERGHGACMNVAAVGSQVGARGFRRDLDRAIYWHRRVVETGTRFGCAGGFSARSLAWIAALHRQGDAAGRDWAAWLDQAVRLYASAAEARPGVDCGTATLHLTGHLLALARHEADGRWLRGAERLLDGQEGRLVTALRLFQERTTWEAALAASDREPEEAQHCGVYFLLGTWSRLQGRADRAAQVEERLANLQSESCRLTALLVEGVAMPPG